MTCTSPCRMPRILGEAPEHGVPSQVRRVSLNLLASLVATGADFLLAFLLVGYVQAAPWLATAWGCALGALVNFGMNRTITFRSRTPAFPQFGRYLLVSAMSMVLNATLVGVLHWTLRALLGPWTYPVVWCLVRGGVFVFWNYPLHVGYVFAHRVRLDA